MVGQLHQSRYPHTMTAQHPNHVTWPLLALQVGHRQLAPQGPSSLALECKLLCIAYCRACGVDGGVVEFHCWLYYVSQAMVPRSKMKAIAIHSGYSSSMIHAC